KHKNLVMGIIGIFFYVGAEVAIGSYLVNYFLEMNMVSAIEGSSFMTSIVESILNTGITDSDSKAIVGVFVAFYWSGAMIGRFAGAYLTKIIKPGKVLGIFATIAIV